MTQNPVKLDHERLATARLLVATGASIREAADRVGLDYGATRKRAWREAWPSSTRVAREVDRRVTQRATDVAATTLAERGAVYEQNIARVAAKFAVRAAAMDPEELLTRAGSVERLDKVGRRVFRLDREKEDMNQVNIQILGNLGGPEHQTVEAQTHYDNT